MVRRRRLTVLGAAAVLVALLAGACGGGNGGDAQGGDVNNPDAPPATAPGGAPAFPLPDDPGAQIRAAGLRELPEDAERRTSTAHVDVIINDHVVEVPAGIGVTPGGTSPLHTSSTDGEVQIDIEADDELDPPTYTLGQLFTLWGVRLDKACVAAYCADESHQLLGFVDGQLVGDPASIAFRDGDQIVVWFGPRGINPSVPVRADGPPGTAG